MIVTVQENLHYVVKNNAVQYIETEFMFDRYLFFCW